MNKEESQQLTEVSKSVVSLKEYFDKQLALSIKNIESKLEGIAMATVIRHDTLQEATRVKAETLEKRFDNTNEWRNTVIEILNKAATKDDLKPVYSKLEDFEQFKNSRLEVPGDIRNLQQEVRDIKQREAKQEGKASQTSVLWAYLISFISFVLALITLLEKITK